MYDKLVREEKEDSSLQDKLNRLENPTTEGDYDIKIFDYVRNVIDDRNALVN